MQHVGVGEHEPGVLADPLALVLGGVAVVERGADAVEVERGERAQLVGRQRLGRRQVERGRRGSVEQAGQRRQLVGQRLAGRRAGRR